MVRSLGSASGFAMAASMKRAQVRIAELEGALRGIIAPMDVPVGENAEGTNAVHDAVELARMILEKTPST